MQKSVIRFCGRCAKRTIWKKKKLHVIPTIIMIVITGGLWVFPWLSGLVKDDVFYCSSCSKDNLWDMIILLFVFVVILLGMIAPFW